MITKEAIEKDNNSSYAVSAGFDGHKLALTSADVVPRHDNWKARCRSQHVDGQRRLVADIAVLNVQSETILYA